MERRARAQRFLIDTDWHVDRHTDWHTDRNLDRHTDRRMA